MLDSNNVGTHGDIVLRYKLRLYLVIVQLTSSSSWGGASSLSSSAASDSERARLDGVPWVVAGVWLDEACDEGREAAALEAVLE